MIGRDIRRLRRLHHPLKKELETLGGKIAGVLFSRQQRLMSGGRRLSLSSDPRLETAKVDEIRRTNRHGRTATVVRVIPRSGPLPNRKGLYFIAQTSAGVGWGENNVNHHAPSRVHEDIVGGSHRHSIVYGHSGFPFAFRKNKMFEWTGLKNGK